MSNAINPYARLLEGRDPIDVMASTARVLAEAVIALGPEGLEKRSRPDGWMAREIVCHLADTEVAFAFRIRQIMAEAHHAIQPFDQDRWNALLPQRGVDDALDTFRTIRRGTVALARTLSDADRSKPVTHPERGEMTLLDVLATIAGHDLNHLRQLASTREAMRGAGR